MIRISKEFSLNKIPLNQKGNFHFCSQVLLFSTSNQELAFNHPQNPMQSVIEDRIS